MKFNLKLVALFLISHLVLATNAFAQYRCELDFVKYVNGEMPADLSRNPGVNMWDERFDPESVIQGLKDVSRKEKVQYIKELSKLIHNDTTFNENFAKLLTRMKEEKILNHKFIRRNFIEKKFEHTFFKYSQGSKKFFSSTKYSPEMEALVARVVKDQKLSKFYKQEYSDIILRTNLTPDDLEAGLKAGMKLRQDPKDLERFRDYMDFLNFTKPHKVRSGIKNIEKVYNYNYAHSVLPVNPIRAPHTQFLEQVSRLENFNTRRIQEIERGLKLQHKNGLVQEIDEAAQREANGVLVHVQEKMRFQKKLDEFKLSSTLKKRAAAQAKHETNIMKRLMNGCNSGSSKRLSGAKKKFSRFKFALALGATPLFYITKNKDKMDSDPAFWEKLGHEMLMGIFFTFIGNKIITNSSSGFWKKYLEGYVKFGALSYVDAWTYEELFGNKSMIRHFQKIYKGSVPDSELEQAFEKLKNSPTFKKDVEELLAYLEDMSKKKNTLNFLDKYLNLTTYSSLDDDVRITQEDLESEEAKEMMMELLAERIYLQSMGKWPFFQTGRKDTDRFAFYRARAVIWDMKGLLLNLTIFELMCREPFGKIGSWGVILGLIVGDSYLTGDLTYQHRREAINQ